MSGPGEVILESAVKPARALQRLVRIPPELLLLGVAAVWGSSYTVAKQITMQVPVLVFLVLRFGITALLLTPTMLRVPGLWTDWRQWGSAVLLGGILLAIFQSETWGVSLTSATHAAFLISLCVVITPLVEWVMLKKRPTWTVLMWSGVCVVGAFLLNPELATNPSTHIGDVLMLLAALLRAVMVTSTRRLNRDIKIPALALTAIQSWLVFAGSCFALFLVTRGSDIVLPMSLNFWGALLYLVLFCTIFAFFAQNYAASRMSPTRVNFLMGSEPMFGALFGSAILGEHLSMMGWMGAALILTATVKVTMTKVH